MRKAERNILVKDYTVHQLLFRFVIFYFYFIVILLSSKVK